MELYPVFEENASISENLWYSISGTGENPSMRVGHTIIHVKDENKKLDKGKFYLIGGANPSGSFNDVYFFDVGTLNWDKFDELENFRHGRYEHSCLYDNRENNIYIFGGSSEHCTYDDILKFDLVSKKCESVKIKNNPPSARTIHTGVIFKNQLVIFGGGANNKTPVEDRNVNIYDPLANKWVSLNIQNNKLNTRQGHIMINYNDKSIYLHGGMDENGMYDDLWNLDLKLFQWEKIDYVSDLKSPIARAAHGGINVKNSIYIFGGIDSNQVALDDLWRYDISN
jgi:N-acetylneuraminic acid mutarotase